VRSLAVVAALGIAVAWVVLHVGATSTANAEVAAPVVPPASRPHEVRSVALDGKLLPTSQLRAVIATRPGALLDTGQLERDRKAMEHLLAELGYLAARVAPPVTTFDAAGAAYVTFEVEQGAMFHFRNIKVTGDGKDAAVVTLGAGEAAVRDRIERARRGLAEALARRGRPAQVELSIYTDVAAAAVDVVIATR